MRQSLPLWFCLDYDTQAKLAPLLSDVFCIPPCVWDDWLSPEARQAIDDYDKLKEIAREMTRKPRPSARSRK